MGFYLNLGSALAAPGVSDALPVGNYSEHLIQCTVAAINTNVVLRIEGSLDGTNFFNLSASDEDKTITANGTYAFRYVGMVDYIRVRFVSESGGTAATVTNSYTGR